MQVLTAKELQRNRYFNRLQSQVHERTGHWFPVKFQTWTPQRWADYMSEVRDNDADRVRNLPPQRKRAESPERSLKELGVELKRRMKVIQMCCFFMTGNSPEGWKANPPRYKPMRPYWLDRLDEIDESFELLDRERRHQGRNPRGSAAAGSSTQKEPLPDIPKRAVNLEPDDSEPDTTSEEEDAQFKEGFGPGENDAMEFNTSESEPHKGKKKMSAEQNAIKRSKWKQRRQAKATGKSSKPQPPTTDRLQRAAKRSKLLSKKGRQRRNKKIKALLEANRQAQNYIKEVAEGDAALDGVASMLTSFLDQAMDREEARMGEEGEGESGK